jgi:fermentation-respiration switch protein FrsA (DUF1100 family)
MAFGARVRAFALLASVGVSSAGCSGFFYFPERRALGEPRQPFREVRIPTRDGLTLSGWFFPAQGAARGTIVQFHGNAGNVTSHFRQLAWVTRYGYSLLTFDYRGYGQSPGEPSQRGLELDALAAIDFAERLPRASTGQDLVLYGQSLGGAVLLHAYASVRERSRIRVLVVESTFHSYSEAAASVCWRTPLLFPFTGFAYAWVSDAYAPASTIGAVAPTPLLVIHGDHDDVVPVAFGYAIYRLAREPRELWIVPGGGHVEAMRRVDYRARLIDYLERR